MTEQNQQLKQRFDEKGYVVVKNVFDLNEVETIIRAFEGEWLKLVQQGEISVRSTRPLESLYPRLRDYHRKNPVIMEQTLKAELFDLMKTIIGEEALVISTSYYFKSPTTRSLPLHQDNYAFGVSPGTTYAAWISLDYTNKENGGLQFVPGTQTTDLSFPDADPTNVKKYFSDTGQGLSVEEDQIEYVETEPGDVVIFNGNIIHGSTENTTDYQFRRCLLTHYTGESVERLALNFNKLINREGEKIRRRLNKDTKITQKQKSVFSIKEAGYFDSWK
ncbi:Ectoine hydroxylase-related dioxygenase, phytanoyl-CoA dioxygenase (PhyH) family [Fictibacillus solisalsi]|uniref:Ectoine hydroxylase-related dioxygenase, phytanoyl-CoA dioxygenase (PhyH) family n=1 Tax=Fictibacillus solisalsi TaxID=459525 RepID=A0A1H0BSH9_9BACL|nr:phytanoyl-CoA dioxygenase family protein [Fictibacillus solisalsi]SDN48536.1 Ectoine hydroxylase-related dioxygenase, phytanoyl-CoA dioxygenase (PhyH) family [Fictibacillus solisalsi]